MALARSFPHQSPSSVNLFFIDNARILRWLGSFWFRLCLQDAGIVVVGTVLPVRPFRSLWLRQCNTKLAVELHALRTVDEAGRMKDLPIRIPFL